MVTFSRVQREVPAVESRTSPLSRFLKVGSQRDTHKEKEWHGGMGEFEVRLY